MELMSKNQDQLTPWFPLPEGKKHLFGECQTLWLQEYDTKYEGSQLNPKELFLMQQVDIREVIDRVLEKGTGEPESLVARKIKEVKTQVETLRPKIKISGKTSIEATQIQTGEIQIFDSVIQSSKTTGVPTNMIHLVCRGDRKNYNGWTFKKIISQDE